MCKKKGFTLIELLVVIAIIALLMSILLPSLTRVRENAKATMCIMNMKTWSTLVSIYTGNNNGYFHGIHVEESAWQNAYRKDYEDQPKIRCCPSAMKPSSEGGKQPFAAWGIFDENAPYGFHVGDYGSYGENGYIQNADPKTWGPSGVEYFRPGGYWKTPYVKGAANAPMFLGCNWMNGFVNAWIGGQSEQIPMAPPFSGAGGDFGMIERYMMDRHNGYVGADFCDFSARKVGMKELFRIKWHRLYDTNRFYDAEEAKGWPDWMKNYKDY